jgi:hypothetical protein
VLPGQAGRVHAADFPGERGAGTVEREQQHLDFAGGHRWLAAGGVQDGVISHAQQARPDSGRSASGDAGWPNNLYNASSD